MFLAGCICNIAQGGGFSAFQESSSIQWAARKYIHGKQMVSMSKLVYSLLY